jgi:hypothetical protein
MGEWEFASETNPAVLKLLLQVRPRMGPDYDWVTCNGCGGQWQVAHWKAAS